MTVLFVKVAVVESLLLAFAAAASSSLDGTAERIVLYGAAGAALLWFWANVLRPFGKLLRRSLKAYEHLEHVPEYLETQAEFQRGTNVRLDLLEQRTMEMGSAMQALTRDLGVDVRGLGRDKR